jgi:metal-dependent amidase/aminoacylase/carboxypeptidase family protein
MGTVVFLFQPAEENITGARAMIRDGVLEDPPPTAIFAYHSAPLEVGEIASNDGLLLPGLDRVRITLRGAGDLATAARSYRRAISSVSTDQQVAPHDFVQAMIGAPEAGSEPGTLVIEGVIRAGSPEARAEAKLAIQEGVAAVRLEDVAGSLEYDDLFLPDVVNDSMLVHAAAGPLRSVVGDGLLELNTVTPYFGEDFAYYQQLIPGAMYWLGVSNSGLGYVGMPHSPDFMADEDAIFVGAKAMAAVLIDYLARQ